MGVMGFYGSLGVYGYLWVSIGLYRCLWVSMSTYRCFWIFGCIWVFMGFIGAYGGLWVSGYIWVLMGGMGVYGYYIKTLKILPIFSFKNPRRFGTPKNVLNHTCVIKNSVCTT